MSGKTLGQIEYLATDKARKRQNKTTFRTKIMTEICCKPRNWYGRLCNRMEVMPVPLPEARLCVSVVSDRSNSLA
jgi:hypothetical protein